MKAAIQTVVLLLAIVAVPASADELYFNGPIDGTFNGASICSASDCAYAISDSFVLTSASTVMGVDFGAWTSLGASVTSLQWSIGTVQGDNSLGGGIAATTDTFFSSNSTYTIANDSFSTGSISLGAGTYYLTLQNATATDGGGVYWDINNGPSSAFCVLGCSPPSNLANEFELGTDSEAFDIQGTTDTGAPEPGSWVLLSLGVIGLIWVKKHRAGDLA